MRIIDAKSFRATNPEMNAVNTPTTIATGEYEMFCGMVKNSTLSKTAEARIIGIESKNENSKASSFGTPKSIRVEMVAPLRDMPGSTAMP